MDFTRRIDLDIPYDDVIPREGRAQGPGLRRPDRDRRPPDPEGKLYLEVEPLGRQPSFTCAATGP